MAVVALLNRPGFPGLPEAIWFKLCRHGGLFQHGVVALLGFGRRDMPMGSRSPVVEPIHPFQGCEFDGLALAETINGLYKAE